MLLHLFLFFISIYHATYVLSFDFSIFVSAENQAFVVMHLIFQSFFKINLDNVVRVCYTLKALVNLACFQQGNQDRKNFKGELK